MRDHYRDDPPASDFTQLCRDMREVQSDAFQEWKIAGGRLAKALPDDDDDDLPRETAPRDTGTDDLVKAFAPDAVRARIAKDTASGRQFAGIADKLIRDDKPMAKALPAPRTPAKPVFNEGIARASLSKLIADGGCTAQQAAKAEGLINRLAAGQHAATRLAKAPTGTDLADMARPQPTSTDTHEQVERASRLFNQLRADGKLTATQAAQFEARLIRCQAEEEGRGYTPNAAGRREATARAAAILSDLARSGSLSAEQVAFYESHIHSAQSRLPAAA